MKKEIDWLKVGGMICTAAGFILTLVSDYIDQKTTEREIATQVEEQVNAYMDSHNFHNV